MTEPAAQLYLVTSPALTADELAPLLDAALAAGPVACVLLHPGATEAGLADLVRRVQARGVAALLRTGDGDLARRVGADGVHLQNQAGLSSVMRRIKPNGIVGVGGLPTRDEAMTAGEAGVDYVMLGDLPDEADFSMRLDRVRWWAELFEVPCVAMTRHRDEIAPFVAAGAEFVAVGDAIWDDPDGPAAAVDKVVRAMAEGHENFLAQRADAR